MDKFKKRRKEKKTKDPNQKNQGRYFLGTYIQELPLLRINKAEENQRPQH